MRHIAFWLYSVLLSCFFFVSFFRPITAINVDLGRHLLLGSIITTTHTVPNINLLSYTYHNYPFINTSWLSEVIFFLLVQYGGFFLLLIVSSIIVFIAVGIQIRFIIQQGYRKEIIAAVATIYVLFLSVRSDIRPEIFSMLFLSLFITILYAFRRTTSKKIFLLILFEMLWVNMHIYFFVGPLLVLLFLIDHLITVKFQKEKTTNYYIFTLLGTSLAACINPNGIKGALFPFVVLQNYGVAVEENQSFFQLYTLSHNPQLLFYLLSILTILIISSLLFFLHKKSLARIDLFLILAFGFSAIIISRNILLFTFLTFLPVCSICSVLLQNYKNLLVSFPKILGRALFLFPCLLLLIVIQRSIVTKGVGFGVVDYQKNAADFFIKNIHEGPVFNTFNSGGYLSFRIYPQLVFVDNRPEAYPKYFLTKTYEHLPTTPSLFVHLDQTYHFNAVFISHWDATPFPNLWYTSLLKNKQYALIYLDPSVFILLKRSEKNMPVIRTYEMRNPMQNVAKTKNIPELLQYLFFFEKINNDAFAKQTIQYLKTRDSNLCIVRNYPFAKDVLTKYVLLSSSCS